MNERLHRITKSVALGSLVLLAIPLGGLWDRARAAGETRTVRLTYYTLTGTTASGVWTGPGVGACSWDLELGTRLRLPDGETFTCLDRGGGLGSAGWLDAWVGSRAEGRWLAGKYGNYVEAEIVN